MPQDDENNPNNNDSSVVIPTIDLSPWTTRNNDDATARQAVVEAVTAACRDIGFLAVTHHGVDKQILQNALTASKAFFDLPLDQKLRHKTDDERAYPYGYENVENLAAGKSSETATRAATTSTADWKETFSMGPDNPASGMPARRIPPLLEPALTEYYAAMERLAAILLEVFATSWQLPPNWFAQRMHCHASALRI